jgi:hypothetical protein
MTKNKMIAFAACAAVALTTFAGGALASEQNSAAKSKPAMRAYNSVVPAADSRYDSGCLTRGPKDSSDYTKCVQNLPAHAMVGGGGY